MNGRGNLRRPAPHLRTWSQREGFGGINSAGVRKQTSMVGLVGGGGGGEPRRAPQVCSFLRLSSTPGHRDSPGCVPLDGRTDGREGRVDGRADGRTLGSEAPLTAAGRRESLRRSAPRCFSRWQAAATVKRDTLSGSAHRKPTHCLQNKK